MATTLQTIYDSVVAGNKDEVEAKVQQVLDEKLPLEEILNRGLIAAMDEVGGRFERGELFVPEMLVAARAMQAGLTLLKPHLVEENIETVAKVIIGTVKGDLHSIGKNLVAMMIEGAGFEIIDLGVDVPPERFASVAQENDVKFVCLSALLTTTMPGMESTIEALEDLGIRESVKVLVGGAPVTETFAKDIGADGYAPDASRAVRLAKKLLEG